MAGFTVRVKVKYIVVVVLVGLFAVIGSARVGSNTLLNRATEAYMNDESELALTLFERYLETCAQCAGVPDALFYSADLLTPPINQYAYVFSNGRRSWPSDAFPLDGMATVEERLRRIVIEFPDSEWMQPALTRLVDTYIREHRWDEAEQLIAIPRARAEHYAKPPYDKQLSEVAFARGDYVRALDIAEAYIESGSAAATFESKLLIGDAYLKLGRVDEAKEQYEALRNSNLRRVVLGNWTNGRDRHRPLEDALALRRRLVAMAEAALGGSGGSVTGRVEGFAAPDVEIMLGPSDEFGTSNPPRPGTYWTADIDSEGRFRFDGLSPGEYTAAIRYTPQTGQLGHALYRGPETVMVRGSEILTVRAGEATEIDFYVADTIRPKHPEGLARLTPEGLSVAWEPVADADFYIIHVGITSDSPEGRMSSSAPPKRTSGTEATFDPVVLRWTHLSFGRSYDASGLLANYVLLGVLHPESETFVYVDAYKGRDIVATSRADNFAWHKDESVIDISALGTLSDEERLITEGRHSDAIEALHARLAAEPEDFIALMVLHRVYSRGIDANGTYKDSQKARDIRRRLIAMGVDEHIAAVLRGEYFGLTVEVPRGR